MAELVFQRQQQVEQTQGVRQCRPVLQDNRRYAPMGKLVDAREAQPVQNSNNSDKSAQLRAKLIDDEEELGHEIQVMGAASGQKEPAVQTETLVDGGGPVQRFHKGKLIHSIHSGQYPQTVGHMYDNVSTKPKSSQKMTIDRKNAKARRKQSLAGWATKKGKDRDEWPMAMFKQGGKGASVRYIDPSDNRGAGSSIGAALQNVPDGNDIDVKAVINKLKQRVIQL